MSEFDNLIASSKLFSPDINDFFKDNGYKNLIYGLLRYLQLKDAKNLDEIEHIYTYFGEARGINFASIFRDEFFPKQSNSSLLIILENKDRMSPDELFPGGFTSIESFKSNGWEELNSLPYPINAFLSKYSKTTVYSSKKLKQSLLLVDDYNDSWIKAFSSILFRILPWFFGKELTKEESEIFIAINKENTDVIINEFDKISAKFDFRRHQLNKMFTSFLNNDRDRKIDEAKASIEEYNESIVSTLGRLKMLYENLEENKKQLNAYSMLEEVSGNELTNIFLRYKNVYIERYQPTQNCIKYYIKDTIEYYNANDLKSIIEQSRSWYQQGSLFSQKIVKEIFLNKKGKIKTCSEFELGCKTLRAIQRFNILEAYDDLDDYIPHPHIYHYACLGGNEQYINEYMKNGDIDMAIEQTIAATKNVNFSDRCVMEKFMKDIDRYANRKIIIANNNEEMTPKEFLKYIAENNNKEDIE